VTDTKTPVIALPKQVRESDLKSPSYKSKVKRHWDKDFDLHYTERFGWVVPTLLISRASGRRSGYQDRTYATSMDGVNCRVGLGPHIKRTVHVYVTDKNLERLQPILDIRSTGAEAANDKRDHISTRRMNSRSLRRTWF
jgi:hypothetical protein